MAGVVSLLYGKDGQMSGLCATAKPDSSAIVIPSVGKEYRLRTHCNRALSPLNFPQLLGRLSVFQAEEMLPPLFAFNTRRYPIAG